MKTKLFLALAIGIATASCTTTAAQKEYIKELEERTLPAAEISLPAPPEELLKRPQPLKPIPLPDKVEKTPEGKPEAVIPR